MVRQPRLAEKRESLAALTGLRFFAAAWVVFYHHAAAALPTRTPSGLRNAASHGYLGVNFFYLLSGFILAYSYAERSASVVALRGTRRAFWMNRFSRVFPLYFTAWLVTAPFVVAHRLATDAAPLMRVLKLVVAAVVSLGLVQAWLPGAHAWWNPPSWSISVEAFFYAIFPWVLPRLLSQRTSRRGLALVVWMSSLLVPILYMMFGVGDLQLAAVKYQPLLHVPTFVLGILLADVFHAQLADPANGSRVLRRPLLLGALGLGAIALVVSRPVSAFHPLIHNGLLSPAFAAVMLAVALKASPVSVALSGPTLVRLGEASFGIYILQAPLWLVWRKNVSGLSSGVDFAIFFVMLCSVAMVTHRAIELPLQRRLRGFSRANPSSG